MSGILRAARSARPALTPQGLVESFASDVARDLARTPKQLQSRYLYDELGSSLFEAICRLPWYRITRAEEKLLGDHARSIAGRLAESGGATIVELGVGSGEKLATIADALPPGLACPVFLIDISAAALDAAQARLSGLSHVSVTRALGTYEEGLARLRSTDDGARKMVLFLGSNIGNFDAPAAAGLLHEIRRAVNAGDLLLLGADLVKPAADLIVAYDDPLGVTAAFNLNLLVRINRELGGNFDLAAFGHRAIWNTADHRVEMHLVSRVRQEVRIPGAGLRIRFEPGETIWTESSYKYTESAIERLGVSAGFAGTEQWTDPDARYTLSLFTAV